MRAAFLIALGLACWTTGCSNVAGPSTTTTGLVGLVVRGPIQPVCRVGVPCDAPFSAGFTLQADHRVVTTFRSDAQGQFDVRVSPGTYVVIPSQDAPIISPSSQAKQVVVGLEGLTNVRLEFDTGIR